VYDNNKEVIVQNQTNNLYLKKKLFKYKNVSVMFYYQYHSCRTHLFQIKSEGSTVITTEQLPFQRNSNVCAFPLNEETTSSRGKTPAL